MQIYSPYCYNCKSTSVSSVDISKSGCLPFPLLKVANSVLLNKLVPRAHPYSNSGCCIPP